MFVTIVIMNGVRLRSSWFKELADAITYAERMWGIESIVDTETNETVWKRQ
jgi:hypothetical protein